VWPPTSIALVALLFLGYRVVPVLFVGALLVNLTTAGNLATSFGIAIGNTLEGVIGAYLVTRYARGREAFERARDLVRFTALAAVLSTTISATCGVASLVLGGFAPRAEIGSLWLTWWLGDATGNLIGTPLLVLWLTNPGVRWRGGRLVEASALFASLLVVGWLVFGGAVPFETLCVPLFVWAAYRFGQREVATAIAIVAGIAIWGTLRGSGPFAGESPNESLLGLQAFMAITGMTGLILAAVVAEHREAEVRLGRLAVTDPLTGLANYRHLSGVLEGEIRRSGRTERPFAVVLIDVDGLKKINDRHGHLVGSRALTRVAEVLHMACRAVDTAARFGGDEFALVLPETDEAAARRVVERIVDRLRQDSEKPTVSISAGIALYARDGETGERLLGVADAALYDNKKRRRA
jgi:diguanylate cyclase (GGDEF)-like protein